MKLRIITKAILLIKMKYFTFFFLMLGFNSFAQSDFPALQKQFLDYRKADKQDSALLIARKMNQLSLQEQTDTSYWFALSFRYLGNPHNTWGNKDSTISYWKQSIDLFKKYHHESSDYAGGLNSLGILHSDMGDNKVAELYYKQALEIYEMTLGKEHHDYSSCLNNLGILYSDMGDYKVAEPYYKQSLAINKKILGEEHPFYAISLNNLGELYYAMGDYNTAEPYFQQALAVNKKALGEEDLDYSNCLNNLGILYYAMGYYKAAEPYYKQALAVIKKALGEEHPDYAKCLNNLGILYNAMGDYNAAEPYYKKALAIRKKALGEEDFEYAKYLNNLGNLYYEMGDYKAVEPYYKQALAIRKKALGEDHPDYAMSLINLGNLYYAMGDYNTFEPYNQQALAIFKQALGEEHPFYATSLFNLGGLYYLIGDYNSAESYYQQALAIRKKALGDQHPSYANSLINLGKLYHEMGDYKAAEPYYKQALAIRKKALGEEHPDYASSLNNLGVLYLNMGDYKAAEPYFIQALEIRKKALGEEHPDYASSLVNLGIFYSDMGDYKLAESFFIKTISIKLGNLNTNFSWLSAQEKQLYWNQEKYFYGNMISFLVSAFESVPTSTELAFNTNLISKSLLLETSRELDQAIAQSSDEEMKTEFSEMKQLRKLYSKMQSEGSTNKEVMERYKTQADSLDKILVNKLGEYAASKRKFEITWKDVQSNLSSSDAAIEFARYYDDKDSLYKYMALVVRPNYEYPKLVKLGEESSIRLAAQNKDFSSLYDLIWKDIDTLLKGVQTVYYSPAGELNSVSFSAMCFEAGDSVLQDIAQNRGVIITTNKEKRQSCNAVLLDKYTLHQLTTTRYLADGTLNKTKPMNSSLALYGGINYDDLPIKSDSISTEITNEEYAFQLNLAKTNSNKKINKKRGKKRSSSNFGEKLEYLPGTKEEITNIAFLMNNSKWEVLSRSDKGTGEYELKKDLETKVPGVLHIATHGFAFPDELKKETNLVDMNQTSTYKVSEDPMVRCGLLLSGANISWTGNPQKMIEQTGDDGILTAAEVANLDLSNTKLVVLSACETGLGKIEGSEGTFGLKRGFKLAGVEQIIVSLWSVPDKETMELMTLFYSDLTKTLNPVISFEKAQKEMRNKYPTDPEKWAGFVLVR
jgi:tetratricopeptide (TPR) repeat protein